MRTHNENGYAILESPVLKSDGRSYRHSAKAVKPFLADRHYSSVGGYGHWNIRCAGCDHWISEEDTALLAEHKAYCLA